MKIRQYLNEATKIQKEIESWLKLKPDMVRFNQTDITRFNFPADILIGMIKEKNDTISIIKYTVEGNIGIQIYKDRNKIKVDKI